MTKMLFCENWKCIQPTKKTWFKRTCTNVLPSVQMQISGEKFNPPKTRLHNNLFLVLVLSLIPVWSSLFAKKKINAWVLCYCLDCCRFYNFRTPLCSNTETEQENLTKAFCIAPLSGVFAAVVLTRRWWWWGWEVDLERSGQVPRLSCSEFGEVGIMSNNVDQKPHSSG